MDVLLKPELARFVDEQVKTGRFETPSQVINTAVASFQTEQAISEPLPPEELDELRADIAKGIEQADRGQLLEWDAEAVLAEVERRYEAERGEKGC